MLARRKTAKISTTNVVTKVATSHLEVNNIDFESNWKRLNIWIRELHWHWSELQSKFAETCIFPYCAHTHDIWINISTRRPTSADSTARRQFQFQYLFISRVHLFYDIQWKRIRSITFI